MKVVRSSLVLYDLRATLDEQFDASISEPLKLFFFLLGLERKSEAKQSSSGARQSGQEQTANN
jgi:hypothetical protein